MQGTIKTYLPEKKYGFIKGDDGKDYWFHENEFRDASQVGHICEEAFVSFDQQATPKGYRARNCRLVSALEVATYVIPDDVISTKTDEAAGWEVIERGEWIVHGTSQDSPDAARRDVVDRARQIGANAVVALDYYKTTGRKGNYKFTIHHFRGRAMMIAKRNSTGRYRQDDLHGLNCRAEELKKQLAKRTRRSKIIRNLIWVALVVLAILTIIVPPISMAVLIFGFLLVRAKDHDGWLEKSAASTPNRPSR